MINSTRFIRNAYKTFLIFGVLSYCNLLSAGGFYLQELGTPSSIGTAGTSRTTNNHALEAAFGNPAGMTGITKDTLVIGSQVLLPKTFLLLTTLFKAPEFQA